MAVLTTTSSKATLFVMVMLPLLQLLKTSDAALPAFTQIGPDINGKAAGDMYGSSTCISADGTLLAVGAPYNDDNGADAGQVRVSKLRSSLDGYTQVGNAIGGEGNTDLFGSSVSMSSDGKTLVVGAYQNDGTGSNAGHVRVYKSPSDNYIQLGTDINGIATDDWFGLSVSMAADGNTFVVGAPSFIPTDGSPPPLPTKPGQVFVYKFIPDDNEYRLFQAAINGEAVGDLFGLSVSMSADGNTFVVGAPGNNNGNGDDAGHVRVYKFDEMSKTYLQFKLDIDGEAADDYFGFSVSMSADGSTFVVGAPLNDSNGVDSGHVRVYILNAGTGTYVLNSDINGEAAGDGFGVSVSMSADGATFVVGAPFNDGNGVDSGRARLFFLNAGTYTIDTTNVFNGEKADDFFGFSVSLSANGKALLVGAPENDNGGVVGFNSGHVRVYQIIPPPTKAPTKVPTKAPVNAPVIVPVNPPVNPPVKAPTNAPVKAPTNAPVKAPTNAPVKTPTNAPIKAPTNAPVKAPTNAPVKVPTNAPVKAPTNAPVKAPTNAPVKAPTKLPTRLPTKEPTNAPTKCGLFGLNILCRGPDKCGFLRRLLGIGGC